MMYTSFLTSSEDDFRRGQQQHFYPRTLSGQQPVSDEESQWESTEGFSRRRVEVGTPSYLLSIQEEEDTSFYDSHAGESESFVGGQQGRRRKPNVHPKGILRVSNM